MREFTEAEQAEFRRLEKEMLAEKAKQRAELAALRYEHEPKHPGVYLREQFMQDGILTPWIGVSSLARDLCVSRKTISQIANGRAGITPEMAMRLSIVFGEDPELWLMRQMKHDLWKVQLRRDELDYRMQCWERNH